MTFYLSPKSDDIYMAGVTRMAISLEHIAEMPPISSPVSSYDHVSRANKLYLGTSKPKYTLYVDHIFLSH